MRGKSYGLRTGGFHASDTFDTGRRGSVVDFDVLMMSSADRRRRAFAGAVYCFPGIAPEYDSYSSLFFQGRNLSDEETVQSVLRAKDLDSSHDSCDALLDRVDSVYNTIEDPRKRKVR
jgi:hypothetical protein